MGGVANLTHDSETVFVAQVMRDGSIATLAQDMHKPTDGGSLSDITYVNSGFALWKHTYGARCPGSPFPCRFQEQWMGVMRVSGGVVEVRYEKHDASVSQSTVVNRLQAVIAGVTVAS